MNSGQTNFNANFSGHSALKSLPKVELHRHLEGALRLSTLKELAPAVGIEVPENALECVNKFLVTTPMKDLGTVLQKFMMTQAVLASEEILTRITYEAIEDAAAEGIRVLELRYAPTFINDGHPTLNWEKITAAVQRGVKMANSLPIAVGFLGTIQRTRSINEALSIMDFFIEHKEHFVGVDLADNEDGFDPKPFAPVFAKAKNQGMPITIHAGEINSESSAQNVKDSIEYLNASRIGHGLQISRDAKIIEFVRKHSITLELCPTSNWLTNAISSPELHPIRQLINAGVLVTINSDDPGIFAIDLTHEYDLLQRKYGFTIADFERCNDIAAQASFIPLLKKQKFWPRPIHEMR